MPPETEMGLFGLGAKQSSQDKVLYKLTGVILVFQCVKTRYSCFTSTVLLPHPSSSLVLTATGPFSVLSLSRGL